MKLETLIGLEFHVQLKTKTKMFCACKNETEKSAPNTNVCPICLGHPGVLPVVNEEAIRLGIKAGLALNCTINKFTKFDRKHYFYPDLPKGYQISQYDKPIAENGYISINFAVADGLAGRRDIEEQLKRVGIIRAHLEEDAAKSTHANDGSLIDFNRGGAPLIEIVTAPHMATPQEAKTLGLEIQLLMRELGISDADMEKGQLRCDANISLRPEGADHLYPKTEIKNINSFRALEHALAYEIKRQTLLWLDNKAPSVEETRGWDDAKGETISQRTKEGAADYRYFSEPDLPPLTFTESDIEAVRALMPELPQAKRRRFAEMHGFKPDEAKLLTADKELAGYTEQVLSELQDWVRTLEVAENLDEDVWKKHEKKLVSLVSGWLINKCLPLLEEMKTTFAKKKVTAENFAEFIKLVYQRKINSTNAQLVLREMIKTGGEPDHIISENDFGTMEEGADLEALIEKIIKNNPDQASDFRAGKEPLIKFFIGLVMKESRGKADPEEAEALLRKHLK